MFLIIIMMRFKTKDPFNPHDMNQKLLITPLTCHVGVSLRPKQTYGRMQYCVGFVSRLHPTYRRCGNASDRSDPGWSGALHLPSLCSADNVLTPLQSGPSSGNALFFLFTRLVVMSCVYFGGGVCFGFAYSTRYAQGQGCRGPLVARYLRYILSLTVFNIKANMDVSLI